VPSEPAPYTLDAIALRARYAIARALLSRQELIADSPDNSELTGHEIYSLCRGQWEIPVEKQKLTIEEVEFLKRSMPNLPGELCG
jgi:hypothetical protein